MWNGTSRRRRGTSLVIVSGFKEVGLEVFPERRQIVTMFNFVRLIVPRGRCRIAERSRPNPSFCSVGWYGCRSDAKYQCQSIIRSVSPSSNDNHLISLREQLRFGDLPRMAFLRLTVCRVDNPVVDRLVKFVRAVNVRTHRKQVYWSWRHPVKCQEYWSMGWWQQWANKTRASLLKSKESSCWRWGWYRIVLNILLHFDKWIIFFVNLLQWQLWTKGGSDDTYKPAII